MTANLAIFATLTVTLIALAAVLIGLRIDREARTRSWERVAVARRANAESRRKLEQRETALAMRAMELESMGLDSVEQHWAAERPLRQADLLLRLVEIETYAQELLNRRIGVDARNVFEIREGLRRLGTWTDDDVSAFDRAMILRNSIVHDKKPDMRALEAVSRSELEQLSQKLQSAVAE